MDMTSSAATNIVMANLHGQKPRLFALSSIELFSKPQLHRFMRFPQRRHPLIICPNDSANWFRKIRADDLSAQFLEALTIARVNLSFPD